MKKKLSKFNEFFGEAQSFDYGFWISAELFTKEEALEEFKKCLPNHNLSLDLIKDDRVRYCCIADPDYGYGNGYAHAWWGGQKGKGSKPVWKISNIYLYEKNNT